MAKKQTNNQSEKFKEAAREHECDESEEVFEKALRRVTSAPPKPEREKKPDE